MSLQKDVLSRTDSRTACASSRLPGFPRPRAESGKLMCKTQLRAWAPPKRVQTRNMPLWQYFDVFNLWLLFQREYSSVSYNEVRSMGSATRLMICGCILLHRVHKHKVCYCVHGTRAALWQQNREVKQGSPSCRCDDDHET